VRRQLAEIYFFKLFVVFYIKGWIHQAFLLTLSLEIASKCAQPCRIGL